MDFRKLIKFGDSSYVVSIPKPWIIKNNLNKGDLVYFTHNSKNELILSPEIKKEKIEQKEITISVDNENMEEIKRRIIAAYINNFHTINLVGNELESKYSEIRNDLHDLMALEIIEQTKNRIVAKDFVNMRKISIPNLIRRIDIITRAMIDDSKATLQKDLYENVYQRDQDVNRITFLIFRAIKYYLNNPVAAEAVKLTPNDLLNYWQIANHLERIADESKRVARFLREVKLNDKEAKKLIEIYSNIENFYLDTMKVYHKEDKEGAYKMTLRKKELIIECNAYFNKHYDKPWVPNIIEKFKAMTDHVHTIVKVIYD